MKIVTVTDEGSSVFLSSKHSKNIINIDKRLIK